MEEREKVYLMALSQIPGMTQMDIGRLVESLGSPCQSWENPGEWRSLLKATAERLEYMTHAQKTIDVDLVYEYSQRIKVKMTTIEDEDYPALLREIALPPYFLFYFGELPREEDFLFTIVGCRRCTRYGRDVAERLAGELAALAGMTIVSGLAAGIDSAAHRGALAAQGKTIAVLPSGIDQIYPSENTRLYREIKEQGCLLTEFPFRFTPLKQTFHYRNRLLSGLSRGVLVVEGRKESGAMITANHAGDQGRDLFAVPGPIFSAQSEAPHNCIKHLGAKLVHSVEDILADYYDLEKFSRSLARTKDQGLDLRDFEPEQQRLLNALSQGRLGFDQLVEVSGLASGPLSALLTEWELRAIVEQLPGKQYVLVKTINEVNNE